MNESHSDLVIWQLPYPLSLSDEDKANIIHQQELNRERNIHDTYNYERGNILIRDYNLDGMLDYCQNKNDQELKYMCITIYVDYKYKKHETITELKFFNLIKQFETNVFRYCVTLLLWKILHENIIERFNFHNLLPFFIDEMLKDESCNFYNELLWFIYPDNIRMIPKYDRLNNVFNSNNIYIISKALYEDALYKLKHSIEIRKETDYVSTPYSKTGLKESLQKVSFPKGFEMEYNKLEDVKANTNNFLICTKSHIMHYNGIAYSTRWREQCFVCNEYSWYYGTLGSNSNNDKEKELIYMEQTKCCKHDLYVHGEEIQELRKIINDINTSCKYCGRYSAEYWIEKNKELDRIRERNEFYNKLIYIGGVIIIGIGVCNMLFEKTN
jgi:hypothetical protein